MSTALAFFLDFLSDLILFTFGLIVLIFWIAIAIVALIEFWDLVKLMWNRFLKSLDEDEEPF